MADVSRDVREHNNFRSQGSASYTSRMALETFYFVSISRNNRTSSEKHCRPKSETNSFPK